MLFFLTQDDKYRFLWTYPWREIGLLLFSFLDFFLSHNNLVFPYQVLYWNCQNIWNVFNVPLTLSTSTLGWTDCTNILSSIHFTKVDTVAFTKSYRTTSAGKTAKFPFQVLAVLYSHTWYTFFLPSRVHGGILQVFYFQWSKTVPLLPSSVPVF